MESYPSMRDEYDSYLSESHQHFFNINIRARIWKVIIPFFGVLINIAAMWLNGYISPALFWLHIPGGKLFGIDFVVVLARAFGEMFGERKNAAQR